MEIATGNSYPFWANLVQKITVEKLKTGTYTNLNIKNSMVVFIFFLFSTRNILFFLNLYPKLKLFVEAENNNLL